METDEMPYEAEQITKKWRIELYAAVEWNHSKLDSLEGIAVADAVSGSCRVSGISFEFSGKPGAITAESEPAVIVYQTHPERYFENFLNRVSAEKTIHEAKQRGYFLRPPAGPPLKMPASFALPTRSQRELAADVATYLEQNIETLVQILMRKNEHGNVKKKDAYSVPLSFKAVGERYGLFHHTVNLSNTFDERYSKLPSIIGKISHTTLR